MKQNPFSLLLAFGTVVFLIFMTTFGGTYFAPAMIMYVLLFSSLVLNRYFIRKEEEAEPDRAKFLQIGLYAVFGLITFIILNIFVPELQFSTSQTVTVNLFTGSIPSIPIGAVWSNAFIAAFVFTVFLVPVAEENFFRVLIGNIALKYLPFFVVIPLIGAVPAIAIVVVGTLFSTFHLAAYGLNYTTLTILWGAGSVLFAFDIAVGDPLPSILSHSMNNGLSLLISGNILVQLIPSLGQFAPHIITPILQITMVGLVAFRGLQIHRRRLKS